MFAHLIVTVFGLLRDASAVSHANVELQTIFSLGKRVIPVLLGPTDFSRLPSYLATYHAIAIDNLDGKGFFDLIRELKPFASPLPSPPQKQDDPQKGKCGGLKASNGRILEAIVSPVSDQWFSIMLKASGTTPALVDPVTFHLHPSFAEPIQTVQPKGSVATLYFAAWGAFTVGVVADQGQTILELDLAELRPRQELFASADLSYRVVWRLSPTQRRKAYQ